MDTVRINPNKIIREAIKRDLKANDGYCPCQVGKTEDTKCPCKNFREMEEGWCICELFEKVKNED